MSTAFRAFVYEQRNEMLMMIFTWRLNFARFLAYC